MPKKEGTDPKREDLHLTFFFTYLLSEPTLISVVPLSILYLVFRKCEAVRLHLQVLDGLASPVEIHSIVDHCLNGLCLFSIDDGELQQKCDEA